jgi:hypothetical protein
LRCGGHLLYVGCGTQETPPSVTGQRKARVVIDAIVSIKTFRKATLRKKSFCEVFSLLEIDETNVSNDSKNFCAQFPKLGFMQMQSGIYTNFLRPAFPLVPLHAILEASFVAPFAAKSTLRMLFAAARGRPPLGRGPTGRTPHC